MHWAQPVTEHCQEFCPAKIPSRNKGVNPREFPHMAAVIQLSSELHYQSQLKMEVSKRSPAFLAVISSVVTNTLSYVIHENRTISSIMQNDDGSASKLRFLSLKC